MTVKPVCRRAVAAVTTLPPKSEAVVQVQMVEHKGTELGLLHSSDSYPKNGLMVGRTLVDLSRIGQVRADTSSGERALSLTNYSLLTTWSCTQRISQQLNKKNSDISSWRMLICSCSPRVLMILDEQTWSSTQSTRDSMTIRQSPRQLPIARREEAIQGMSCQGLIEPSGIPSCSRPEERWKRQILC